MSINRLDIHFETNKILWDIKCHWFESKCLKFPRDFIHPNFNSSSIQMQCRARQGNILTFLHCIAGKLQFGLVSWQTKDMTWHNLGHRRHCLKGSPLWYFILCFLRLVSFESMLSQRLHLSSTVQSGALWLTGGRTEKDRNLAILDRASGIKSGKSWQRTGDKSRHNIGQGTFSFLCLRASAPYFLIFSSLSERSRSFIHQQIISRVFRRSVNSIK